MEPPELTPEALDALEAALDQAGGGRVSLKAALLRALITTARGRYEQRADGQEPADVSKREWELLLQEREQMRAEIAEMRNRLARRDPGGAADITVSEPLVAVTLKSGIIDRFPCSEFKALKHSVKFITPPGWRARRYFWDDISSIESGQKPD